MASISGPKCSDLQSISPKFSRLRRARGTRRRAQLVAAGRRIATPHEALATRARFHLSAEPQIHTPLFCVNPFELEHTYTHLAPRAQALARTAVHSTWVHAGYSRCTVSSQLAYGAWQHMRVIEQHVTQLRWIALAFAVHASGARWRLRARAHASTGCPLVPPFSAVGRSRAPRAQPCSTLAPPPDA